jgi:hypothetical protein
MFPFPASRADMSFLIGVALVVFGGVLSGLFTLPMQYCKSWPWEACWYDDSFLLLAIELNHFLGILTFLRLVYSIVGLFTIPVATAFSSFPSAFEVSFHILEFSNCADSQTLKLCCSTLVAGTSSCFSVKYCFDH